MDKKIQKHEILPVEEMIAYEEFTDRVEILRELDAWVKRIQIMGSPSTAIISPRRLGKSVLLDRLVNEVFFKPEYKVAPFYFRMQRADVTLRYFLLEYATTFFRQYVAYCLQDPLLYSDRSVTIENLLDIPSDHKAVQMAKKFAEGFLKRYQRQLYNETRNHWTNFICEPERLASHSGTRVAIIIDEFQDMQFYVHDVNDEYLDVIKEKRTQNPYKVGINLPATYDRQAQSRKAPMLVSGSAVTLVFKTVMGGPLGGRFFFKYLKPMSIPDGASLLRQLIKIYHRDEYIGTEDALYASAQVGGHPYYLYCIAMSQCEGKIFKDKENIDKIIRYEIEDGNIYGFWQTHFANNRKYINEDNDEETGKKIIYYFTKYNNQPVEIEEIAQTLKIPKKTVEEKIEKLYMADMVYRSSARYFTFNDICLMRFIKFVYEKDLKGIDEIDLSQQNLFNNLKGRFLEIVAQITMMKFNCETLDGNFFGKTEKVTVPLFQYVKTKHVKAVKTPQYQIDVLGMFHSGKKAWICECKYTKTKMGISQVKKLEQAGDAFKQESLDSKLDPPEIQMWLISTGGFTSEVLEYTKYREDIYLSDHEGINGIFQFYGGNYKIPLFKKEKKINET